MNYIITWDKPVWVHIRTIKDLKTFKKKLRTCQLFMDLPTDCDEKKKQVECQLESQQLECSVKIVMDVFL